MECFLAFTSLINHPLFVVSVQIPCIHRHVVQYISNTVILGVPIGLACQRSRVSHPSHIVGVSIYRYDFGVSLKVGGRKCANVAFGMGGPVADRLAPHVEGEKLEVEELEIEMGDGFLAGHLLVVVIHG